MTTLRPNSSKVRRDSGGPKRPATSSPNPYVFVVGCNRSGTTLLQRMLDSHPDLAVVHEASFIPSAHRALREPGSGGSSAEAADWLLGYRKFHVLGLSEATVSEVADRTATFVEFVSELFTEVGRSKGKPFVGEKCPGYVMHLSLLGELFPWTRFVHVVRDGRDVALSALEWEGHGPSMRYALWEDEPVAVCALWWRRRVSAGRAAGRMLGPGRFREVRYEALVQRPEEAVRDLAGFLELPFDQRMLRFHEGRTRADPGLSAKAAWLPPTPGLRDWRSQMAGRDVELFEALAGRLLSDMGYERASPDISSAIASLAQRYRRRFEAERPRRRIRKG